MLQLSRPQNFAWWADVVRRPGSSENAEGKGSGFDSRRSAPVQHILLDLDDSEDAEHEGGRKDDEEDEDEDDDYENENSVSSFFLLASSLAPAQYMYVWSNSLRQWQDVPTYHWYTIGRIRRGKDT